MPRLSPPQFDHRLAPRCAVGFLLVVAGGCFQQAVYPPPPGMIAQPVAMQPGPGPGQPVMLLPPGAQSPPPAIGAAGETIGPGVPVDPYYSPQTPVMLPQDAPYVPQPPGYGATQLILLENPTRIPVTDREYAFEVIADVVDDFFRIEREERVRLAGDVLIEGRIDTYPLTGATLLEPWLEDSVNFYERLESTLQSIRRRAFIRVIPEQNAFLVEISVMKELEAVERPAYATTGAATFRNDNSLDRNTEPLPSQLGQVGDQPRPVANPTLTAGWIPLARDTALEQVMLARLQQRFGGRP